LVTYPCPQGFSSQLASKQCIRPQLLPVIQWRKQKNDGQLLYSKFHNSRLIYLDGGFWLYTHTATAILPMHESINLCMWNSYYIMGYQVIRK
jgi:hypothetical protein